MKRKPKITAWDIATKLAVMEKENDIEVYGPKILALMDGVSRDVFWELDEKPGRYNYMDDRFYMLRSVRNAPEWGKKLFANLKENKKKEPKPKASKGNYREFDTLPENWTRAIWREVKEKDFKLVNEADPYKWSGDIAPPKIGDRITAHINDFGTGTVLKYFVEYGWLGVVVEIDEPPAWYVKQNGGNPPGHFFGIDLEPRGVV